MVGNLMPDVLGKKVINGAWEYMEGIKQGVKMYEDVKWNRNGNYYIDNSLIVKFVSQAFETCFIRKEI
jgi:hypothetical protein